MSENSKCGTGCVVGVTTSEVKLPNLVSPSEVVAGKRPCLGKLPFNVPWCRKSKGWPAGSMVHNKCGYFFNTVRAYGDPCDADSEWIEFDFKFLFNKLLETMSCGPTVPHLEDDVKVWDPEITNVAQPCDTWVFTVEDLDDEGNVIGCHQVFASALEPDLIKDIYDKPTAWSDPKTSAQLMCELLTNPNGVKSIDDSNPNTTTITLNNGTTLVSDEEQSPPDTYIKSAELNADGSGYTMTRVDADGNVVATFTIPLPAAPTNCAGQTVSKFVGCSEMGEGLSWDTASGSYKVDFPAFPEIPAQTPVQNCKGRDATQFVGCDEMGPQFSFENGVYVLNKECTDLESLGETCGDLQLMVAIPNGTDADGNTCYRYGTVTEQDLSLGVFFNSIHEDVFPTDTSAGSPELYDYFALDAANKAGTVDQNLLLNSVVACGEITAPCDMTYTEEWVQGVEHTYDYPGQGRFVYTVGGVLATNNNGSLKATDTFTNGISTGRGSGELTLKKGVNTICRYYVSVNPATPVAQIRRQSGTTQITRGVGSS